jgi:pyruvate ferredoxin oxidoreductase alpha subunit
MLQAVRIAETAKLPVMVTTDGFIISHGMERLEILPDADAKAFVGKYKPENYLLNFEKLITVGALDLTDYYFEHRRQLAEGMKNSRQIILDVAKEYGAKFGRTYGLFEQYKMEGAEIAIVAMGSTAGTAKVVVDGLRSKGMKAGLIKPRVFRPFPKEELAVALKGLKAVAVMDRSDAMNAQEGPLALEIKAALFDASTSTGTSKTVLDYIYGLGGREIKPEDIEFIYNDLNEAVKGQAKQKVTYLGVRE